jgi:hypothetical protein
LFQIHPFIKEEDIFIFDEFSILGHEFMALETFKKRMGKDWKFQFIRAIKYFRQIALQIK